MKYSLFILKRSINLNNIPPAEADYNQNYKQWSDQTIDNIKPATVIVREDIYKAVTERDKNASEYDIHDVRIPEFVLNDYVERFADVLLETPGRHAKLYASDNWDPIDTPSSVPSAIENRLSEEKSLSGDMGGVIGEGLFVSMLIQHFQMEENDFAHLDPGNERRFPDFGLIRLSQDLKQCIEAPSSGQLSYVFPVEVKSKASFTQPSNLTGQLNSAFAQLISFWEQMGSMGGGQHPGMIFYALRNPDAQTYDLVIIPIK